jgi:hypothetical protein
MAFTQRYTEEQREAIYRLIHEDGKTPGEAVAVAAHGVYGLEPFSMPVSSARPIARRIKLKREGRPTKLADRPLDEVLDNFCRRSLTVLDREMSKHEQDVRAGCLDTDGLRWTLRRITELAGIVKTATAKGLLPANGNGMSEQSSSSEFLERLTEAHAGGASKN